MPMIHRFLSSLSNDQRLPIIMEHSLRSCLVIDEGLSRSSAASKFIALVDGIRDLQRQLDPNLEGIRSNLTQAMELIKSAGLEHDTTFKKR